MKNVKEILKEKLSGINEWLEDIDLDEWPPKCVGALYEPVRPAKMIHSDDEE